MNPEQFERLLHALENLKPTFFSFEAIAQLVLSIIGILAALLIAKASIKSSLDLFKKTVKDNKINVTFSRTVDCIIQTCEILNEYLTHFQDIINRVVYCEGDPYEEEPEIALDRYKKEKEELSKRYVLIIVEHNLVLPEEIFEKLPKIIEGINSCDEEVEIIKPEEYGNPSVSKELSKKYKVLETDFREFVKDCRSYLGAEHLKPLSDKALKSVRTIKRK